MNLLLHSLIYRKFVTNYLSIADGDFDPEGNSSDDEETIAKAEADISADATANELAELERESELPIEELLRSLPPEVSTRSLRPNYKGLIRKSLQTYIKFSAIALPRVEIESVMMLIFFVNLLDEENNFLN